MDIDTTKPNAGRIYDYMLGGHHNFEVDRIAAERLMQFAPTLPKWMRLNRWFMNVAVDQLASTGFSHYIDLATGLPTQGYLHERVPQTARIIYNDIDPATVAYARQVLTNQSNIHYIHADARQIDDILAQTETFFGPARLVGICMVGVAYFMDDTAVANVLQRLYNWAAPGSKLALSFITVDHALDPDDPTLVMYRQMNSPMYPRTLEQIHQLTGPWKLLAPGLRKLEEYAQEQISATIQIEQTQARESMVGGVYEKPATTA